MLWEREVVHEAVGTNAEGEELVRIVPETAGTVPFILSVGDEANEDGVGPEGAVRVQRLGVGGGGPEDFVEPFGGDAVVVG